MNTKEKGDSLENLVAALEKASFSNPETKVIPNYKLRDSTGIERDIDIYFETIVNNKIFKYGIECKNFGHKTPVKMQDIDSLWGKINMTGVNGIIVTTGHIQKNAIEKATAYGIEVYQILENDSPIFAKSNLLIKRKAVKNVRFFSKELHSLNETKWILLEKLFYGKGKDEVAKIDFLQKFELVIIDELSKNNQILYQEFFKLYKNKKQVKIDLGKKESKVFNFKLKNFFHKENASFYEISNLGVEIELWIENVPNLKPTGRKYISLTQNITFSKFLTLSFQYLGENLVWNSIVDEKSKNIKNIILNPKKKQQIFIDDEINHLDSEWEIIYMK